MFDETEKEILFGLLRFCLKQLVNGGYVEENDILGRFHVDFEATDKLVGSGQAAATVQDRKGHAVVLLDPFLGLKAAIWAIPHEAVHATQFCCGDLVNLGRGRKRWKGKVYESLASDDPYYSEQPWEAEAFALDGRLREAMRKQYPGLASLLPEEVR